MSDYSSTDSGNKSAVVIFVIVAVVILLILLACGGIVFFVFMSMKTGIEMVVKMAEEAEKSQQVARTFVADVQTNRLDAAYESTSADFKKRMSRQEFDDFVKKHPNLQTVQVGMLPHEPPMVAPGMITMSFGLTRPNRSLPDFKLTVTKEGEIWKVDQLTVDEQQGAENVVDAFLGALRDGKLDVALQSGTTGLREKWPRERLQAVLKKHAIPRGVTTTLTPVEVNEIRGNKFYVTVLGPNGQLEPYTVTVVRDGKVWKIENLEWDDE